MYLVTALSLGGNILLSNKVRTLEYFRQCTFDCSRRSSACRESLMSENRRLQNRSKQICKNIYIEIFIING